MSASTFTIVCSDQARTGKTLVASFLADYLIHKGGDVRVFDLDSPGGDLASKFTACSSVIDLTRTRSVMALFDSVVAPPPRDYVVDLPHHQVARFLDLIGEIDFIATAELQGIAIRVLFICNQTIASIVAARSFRSEVGKASFVLVRNEGVAGTEINPDLAWAFEGLSRSGFFTVPRMVSSTRDCLAQRTYSFSMFLDPATPVALREEYYSAHVFFTTIFKEFGKLDAAFDLDRFKLDLDRWKSGTARGDRPDRFVD